MPGASALIVSRPFDPFILLTIACNCVTMAWESPLDPCCTAKAAFIDVNGHTMPPRESGSPVLHSERPLVDELLPTNGTRSERAPIGPSRDSVTRPPQVCEWIFLYIFTIELTVKMVAMTPAGYLRDAW